MCNGAGSSGVLYRFIFVEYWVLSIIFSSGETRDLIGGGGAFKGPGHFRGTLGYKAFLLLFEKLKCVVGFPITFSLGAIFRNCMELRGIVRNCSELRGIVRNRAE